MADDEGETILPLIYKWNREDIAKVIMNTSRYNIFAETYKDKILLFSALEGHLKSFEHILELVAVEESVTTKLVLLMHTDTVGNNVLHLAITLGCLELVKYLINEIKLDIIVSNNCGQSCVDLVLKQDQPLITAYFTENWENFYIEGENYPDHSICQNRELLKLLNMCKNICHVNHNGCTALHIACQRGDTKIAEFLLSNHGLFLPDNNGFTPLHTACMHGNLKVVIVFNEEIKMIAEWLYRSHNNNTALHLAARYDKVLIVRYIVENNICDIDLRGENGQTPLILAAFYKSYETLKFLIDSCSKWDYSMTDDSGKTAFWYIYNQGNVDIINYCLNAFNCKIEGNYKKKALLYTATEKGQYVAFKLICESMKNDPVMQISDRILQETDDYGNTSLHLASKFGHLEVVEYLVENIKLSLNIINLDGQTCFDLALRHECIEIVEYLTKYASKNFFNPDLNGEAPHIFVPDKVRHIILHQACRHGLLNIVKYFVDEVKIEVLCKDKKGLNALHHACIGGHLDVVHFLNSGSSLGVADHEGYTPLHHASCCGCLDVVQYLVSQKPSELMTRDHDNNTPLHLATKHNKTSIVNYFLDENLYDCNLRGELGRTPLLIAIEYDCSETFTYLFYDHSKCDTLIADDGGKTALSYLYERDNLDVICDIISKSNYDIISITKACQVHLYSAVEEGHLSSFYYILNSMGKDFNHMFKHVLSMNTDEVENTALHLACKYGRIETVKYIIDKVRLSPTTTNKEGQTCFHLACRYGQLSILQYLCSIDGNIFCRDHDGSTPIHIACQYGQLSIFKFISTTKSERVLDNNGRNPLHIACYYGHLEIVKLCVQNLNFDQFLRDRQGLTPLAHACACNRLDVVCYLDTNITPIVDNTGYTPLHHACKHGHFKIVQYITLEKTSDLIYHDHDNNTPLHVAARYNQTEVVEYFLKQHWYDSNLRGENGRTPLHIAAAYNCGRTLNYLLRFPLIDPWMQDGSGKSSFLYLSKACINDIVLEILRSAEYTTECQMFEARVFLYLAAQPNQHQSFKHLLRDLTALRDIKEETFLRLNTDNLGNTALHIACKFGSLETVQYILDEIRFPSNTHNIDSQTCLHLASKHGQLSIVNYLTRSNKCDPLVYNSDGNTPLHLACLAGHYDIFKMLFTTTKYDIHERNKLGKSIADYAQDKPDMARTIREVYGVEATFVPKIFVIGFSGAGKSTLVSALQKETRFLGRYFSIPKVPPHTVGVTPVRFQSSSYGTVNLYDFAGHEEYHANHQLLFQSSYLPIIILLVNLEEEDIISCIKYWVNILRNSLASHAGIKRGANIIILGSHYDQIHGDKKNKINNLEDKIEKILSKLEDEEIKYNRGIICLDCRKPSSDGMEELRSLMHSSCLACRAKIAENCSFETSLICQEILFFLNNSVSFKLACTVIDICRIARKGLIHDRIKSDEEMFEMCSTLSFYGKIMLLINSDHQEDSWIILDEKYILSEFHSSMHKHKKSLSDQVSCGLVSKSQLQQLFPNNLELILKYLQYSQICVEIEAESFSIIPQSLLMGSYYFFPYLTQENKPNWFILQSAEDMTPFYCWQLVCHDPLTPRFLHVLLVQLTVPVPGAGDVVPPNYTVWKNGIHIRNNDTTESIIEVTNPACQFIFATRCKKGGETNLLRRRSQLIHLIRSVLVRNCPLITDEEFIYEPQSSYPIDAYAKKVSLKMVAGVLLEGRSTLATQDNQYLDLVTLLGNDPLLLLNKRNIRTLKRIFLHPNDIIPQSIACEYQKLLEPIMKKEKFSTYKELHKCVHQYSIFSDRNIWVSTNPISTIVMMKIFFPGYSWFRIKATPSM